MDGHPPDATTTTTARVLTVTVNPAVDHTLWIPGFSAGVVNRVERENLRAGGKGVNVAARLAQLGITVAATGVIGRDNAHPFESLFDSLAIADHFLRRDGTTRTGIKIVDPTDSETTDINFGGTALDTATATQLEGLVADLAAAGGWVVLAGSLPPNSPTDLYGRLTQIAHDHGASVAVDTSGPALAAALDARPDLIKPNDHELAELVGRPLNDETDIIAAARDLVDQGITNVIVSMGADGALFCNTDGVVHAGVAPVEVVSTVGAGDSMVAGTIAGLLDGLTPEATLAFATACSALAISAVDATLTRDAVERLAATIDTRIHDERPDDGRSRQGDIVDDATARSYEHAPKGDR